MGEQDRTGAAAQQDNPLAEQLAEASDAQVEQAEQVAGDVAEDVTHAEDPATGE